MMKHIYFVVGLLGISSLGVSAQDIFSKYKVQPEVWHPSKPFEPGVDAKGDLGLNIPLMTVPGLNGLDYPVNLNYKSGIQVGQKSGWVGLGWSLSSGGSVTRDVKGGLRYFPSTPDSPEDYKGKFRYYGADFADIPQKDGPEYTGQIKASAFMHPDVYQVDVPGNSFQMSRGRNNASPNTAYTDILKGDFMITSWQPWKVDFTTGVGAASGAQMWLNNTKYTPSVLAQNGFTDKEEFSKFVLHAPDGTRYVFGTTIMTSDVPGNSVTVPTTQDSPTRQYYVSSWLLTSILSPDYVGKDDPDSTAIGGWIKLNYSIQTNTNPDQSYLGQQTAYLTSVETPTNYATFITEEKQELITPTVKQPFLKDIRLYAKAKPFSLNSTDLTLVKQITLAYTTGISFYESTTGYNSRYNLASISFQEYLNNTSLPGYNFTYYGVCTTSLACTDNTPVNAVDTDDFGFYYPNSTGNPVLYGQSFNLKSILHPTGAQDIFTYQTDEVRDQNAGTMSYVNGEQVFTPTTPPYLRIPYSILKFSESSTPLTTGYYNPKNGAYSALLRQGGSRVVQIDHYNGDFITASIGLSGTGLLNKQQELLLSSTTFEYPINGGITNGVPHEYIKKRLLNGISEFFVPSYRASVAVYYPRITQRTQTYTYSANTATPEVIGAVTDTYYSTSLLPDELTDLNAPKENYSVSGNFPEMVKAIRFIPTSSMAGTYWSESNEDMLWGKPYKVIKQGSGWVNTSWTFYDLNKHTLISDALGPNMSSFPATGTALLQWDYLNWYAQNNVVQQNERTCKGGCTEKKTSFYILPNWGLLRGSAVTSSMGDTTTPVINTEYTYPFDVSPLVFDPVQEDPSGTRQAKSRIYSNLLSDDPIIYPNLVVVSGSRKITSGNAHYVNMRYRNMAGYKIREITSTCVNGDCVQQGSITTWKAFQPNEDLSIGSSLILLPDNTDKSEEFQIHYVWHPHQNFVWKHELPQTQPQDFTLWRAYQLSDYNTYVQPVNGWVRTNTNAVFDDWGHVLTSYDVNKNPTQFTYDPIKRRDLLSVNVNNTFTMRLEYQPALGLVTAVRDVNDQLLAQYSFDGFGRLLNIKDQNSQILKEYAYYLYRSTPPPNNITYTTANTNRLNFVRTVLYPDTNQSRTSYVYLNSVGLSVQAQAYTDLGGSTATVGGITAYDALGRATESFHPLSVSVNNKFYGTYNQKQEDFLTLVRTNTTNTYGGTASTRVIYDNMGQVIQSCAPFATNATQACTTTTYQIDGLQMKQTITDAEGHKLETYTDGAGRKIREVRYNGTTPITTLFAYTPTSTLKKVTDPIGLISTYVYNNLGQILQKTTQDAGTVKYKYDLGGKLRYSQDANQAIAGKYSYTVYDTFDRPVYSGEATGTFNTLNPDVIPASETSTSSANTLNINIYDAKPANGTGVFATGQNLAAFNTKIQALTLNNLKTQPVIRAFKTDQNANTWQVEALSYNTKAQLTKYYQFTQTTPTTFLPDLSIEYTYNLLGEVTATKKTIGSDSWYDQTTYNTLGQPQNIRSDVSLGNNPRLDFTYNAAGQVTQTAFPRMTGNGTTNLNIPTRYTIQGWVSKIGDLDNSANTGTTSLYPFQAKYTYSLTGNILESIYRNASSTLASGAYPQYKYAYQYDGLNQLKGADFSIYTSNTASTTTNAYDLTNITYDANGNILTMNRRNQSGGMEDQLSYSYVNNRLTKVIDNAYNNVPGYIQSSASMQYDANGNLNSVADEVDYETQFTATYDVRNLPTSITHITGGNATYRYNAAGQRIYKNVNGTVEHYVMNGSATIAVLNANGSLKYWVTPFGRAEKTGSSYVVYYYLKDHLGSTRVVLKEDGTKVEGIDYDPWGVVLGGRSYQNGSLTKERFTGKERDAESGLDYFGARYYNPGLGRWLSVDPLAEKYPSWSPYNYVLNNPVNAIDPDGRDIVYYNGRGEEVRRIQTTEQYETYVDLNGDGNYSSAPMPNIIKGYENEKYQKYDHLIAAHTLIFNNTHATKRPTTQNELLLDGEQPVALSPTLVKAIILKETVGGTIPGNDGQNGTSDIMQANVTITNSKGQVTDSDWADFKTKLGLVKDNSATPEQSIYAGIRILYMKGMTVDNVIYENGNVSPSSNVSWKGGNLNSWWFAVRNYNGSGQRESYVRTVYGYWNNSFFSKSSQYYSK